MKRLAFLLRRVAGRIDREGTPKHMSYSFTFEDGEGIRFRDDGRGCPLWYLGEADYERAHAEADRPGARRLADGEGPADAGGMAVNAPAKNEPAPADCPGFRWIGQSFASCDGCGKPAWEHEGEMRLREGAGPFGGDGDWELRPWGPGEAEAIKRKWS